MNKRICFKINNINLYQDIILLDIDYPELFVCRDNSGQRYLVLCTDYEDYEFFVMSITRDLLLSIIKGEEEIKSAFIKAAEFYKVYPGKTLEDDRIIRVNTSDLASKDLPDNETFFSISTPEIDKYIFQLSNYEFETCKTESLNSIAKTNNVIYETQPLRISSMSSIIYLTKCTINQFADSNNDRKDYYIYGRKEYMCWI